MQPVNHDIAITKRRRRGQPWVQDPIILQRLPDVERRHLAGQYNTAIAVALGVSEQTIRADIKRLNKLWIERAGAAVDELRARAIADLEDIKRRALSAAEWDQMCERAVLFDDLEDDTATTLAGEPAKRKVYRDEKGSASYRGQKAQALNVARQAIVDQAKILGIVTEKAELSGAVLIREYGVPTGKV